MEVPETDSVTKSAKKKKKYFDEEKNRKISDFFKTPDKSVDKQKQKSLLQFFTPAEQEKKIEINLSNENGPDGDVIVDVTDKPAPLEITPSNSDKENLDVSEHDTNENVGVESLSIVTQRVNGDSAVNGNNNGPLKKKNSEETNFSQSHKAKHKKHKKKHKLKDDRVNGDLSDSIILLSDSSLGSSPDAEVDGVEKEISGCDQIEIKLKSEGTSDAPVVGKGAKADQTFDISVFAGKNSKAVAVEKNDKEDDESKVNGTTKSNPSNGSLSLGENKNYSVELSGVEKSKKKKERKLLSIETNLSVFASSSLVQKEVSETDVKDKRNAVELQQSKIVKGKKSALKGKDMLNLLKEIQSAESAESQKRKQRKKHKHKHKDKQEVKVHELANSDDHSDSKDDAKAAVEEVESVSQEKLKRNSDSSEIGKEEGTRVFRGRNNSGTVEKIDEKQMLNKALKPNKDKLKKKKQGRKEKNEEISEETHSQSLSYKSFKDNLAKTSTEESNGKKESATMEMSYTEYLQMMESSSKGDDTGDAENETDFKNENEEMCLEKEKDETKLFDTAELDSKASKSGIAQFFTVMTSTPDRLKKTSRQEKTVENKTNEAVEKSMKNANITKCKGKNKHHLADSVEKVECEVMKTNKNCNEDNIEDKVVPTKSLFTGKKTQATLCFGKGGLSVSKPATEEITENKNKNSDNETNTIESIAEVTEAETKCNKVKKSARGRKPKKKVEDLNIMDNSVFATPVDVKKRQGKRKYDVSADGDSESAESDERRRSLRKRYKVEAFQMDADQKTPIKIKLKRCPKSSSSGEDADKSTVSTKKIKVNAKQSTAQVLLKKAKRGKHKKHKLKTSHTEVLEMAIANSSKKKVKKLKPRNESNSSEDSATRRSSRLEGRVMASMEEVSLENIVISSSEDEADIAAHKAAKKRRKFLKSATSKKGSINEDVAKTMKASTDVKGTPKKSPKKKSGTPVKNKSDVKKKGADVKLAPMFLMGKNKQAVPSPKKPPLDPELLKQRQQFLMSGVPEELKKQTATRITSTADLDYPPIPKINHVLQVPASDSSHSHPGLLNVWDLEDVKLKERRFIIPSIIHTKARFSGDLMSTYEMKLMDFSHIKNFQKHEPMSETDVELCLKELGCLNPPYPVNAMYKSLKEMKIETEKLPAKSESMLKTDMKGILDDCKDMVVIDGDEDEEQTKKRGKKSLKLQKKEQTEEVKIETKTEEKVKGAGSSLLWTEKYCPAKTSEVLGNSIIMKKLKTWLTEWKHVLDREARKAQKLLMKKNKGKQLPSKKDDDDLWDDDSDFDKDSDGSDEEESLCNTVLLSGPHGCGKTCSVYALALELGFKVHEVNASSCRSGKQILSQLQEATQSHQVSSQGCHTPRKNTALAEKTKSENNKLPTAFTNLFKKSVANEQNKTDEKDTGKKRKRNKSDKDGSPKSKRKRGEKHGSEIKHKTLQLVLEDSSSQSAVKSLNLSSTTLILFDEVDVVFDEDRGFLSAIQTFMSNTKIPIILTTADPGFVRTFDGRFEHLCLKRPSMGSILSYLQTVSLVENIRTDPILLAELVQLYNCDVRRCLVTLQFLLETGGGHDRNSKTIQTYSLKNFHKSLSVLACNSDMENSQDSLHDEVTNAQKVEDSADVANKTESSRDANDSEDDFVTIKPLKKRRRVLEDDNSNSLDSLQSLVPVSSNIIKEESSSGENCFPVHGIGVESLLRNGKLSVFETLTQGLKATSTTDLKEMICKCHCIRRSLNVDPFYNNLHILLPFTIKVTDGVFKMSNESNRNKNKQRKRIRVNSDLYDSEASNDAVMTENVDKLNEEINEKVEQTETIGGNTSGDKNENLCMARSLSSFSKFYETVSALDMFETMESMKIGDNMQNVCGRELRGTLVAGVGNDLANFTTASEVNLETCRTYSSEIEARSACKFYREIDSVQETVEKLCVDNPALRENFVLPVVKQSERFTLINNTHISVPPDFRKAINNTSDNLPLVTHSQTRSLHLDYLPTLREICRNEQRRQITNTKRRFHHYLDSITLPLKDKTISTLATTFIQ